MRKAIVLSSGGIDSTTCLAMAIDEFGTENVVSVSAIYGQKHSKEIECARKIATYYGVAHREIDITSLNIFEGSTCTLLQENAGSVAQGTYAEQVNEGIVSTYVPFRNGVLLSLVAAMALSMFPDDEILVYVGIHSDDVAGSAYADCTFQFANAMNEAIRAGTYGKVGVSAPLVDWTKADVVRVGHQLGAPFELTWSCYNGGEHPCGTCATCLDRRKAFEANNLKDPVV